MTHKRFFTIGGSFSLGAAIALTLALLLGAFGGSGGGVPLATAPNGTGEGIAVHGHWTVEVTDPDGTTVSRTEFENALSSIGELALATFLSRSSPVGSWQIELADNVCENNSGTPTTCFITEDSFTQNQYFPNLTVTRLDSTVVLEGTAIVQRDDEISAVRTYVTVCLASTTPEDCDATTSPFPVFPFTATALSPAIPVVTGQIIDVRVEISFSTGTSSVVVQ